MAAAAASLAWIDRERLAVLQQRNLSKGAFSRGYLNEIRVGEGVWFRPTSNRIVVRFIF